MSQSARAMFALMRYAVCSIQPHAIGPYQKRGFLSKGSLASARPVAK